jgi:hypothetical protein
MSNKNLTIFTQTLAEFKLLLWNDPTIRKLLVYDTPDALSKEVPSIELDSSKYIFTCPIMESGLVDFNRKVYIMMDLKDIDVDTSSDDSTKDIDASLYITPITTDECWELNDNKFRLIEICDKIVDLIDGKKFSLSSKPAILMVSREIIDKRLYGYSVRILLSNNPESADF